jgi:hypothetical protein
VALCSTPADGSARNELRDILGADSQQAADFAGRLVMNPHALIACGAATWNRPAFETDAIAAWRGGLSSGVETGHPQPGGSRFMDGASHAWAHPVIPHAHRSIGRPPYGHGPGYEGVVVTALPACSGLFFGLLQPLVHPIAPGAAGSDR